MNLTFLIFLSDDNDNITKCDICQEIRVKYKMDIAYFSKKLYYFI